MRYRKFSASSLALAFAAVIPLIFFGATIVSTCAFSQEVVTVGPSSLPNGSVGKPYTQLIRATDNDSDDDDFFTNDPEDSYTYAVTAGSLPPGLTLGSGPADRKS